MLAGSRDKEPSESYLPSLATHREGGEAWPLSDKEPADPVGGRGRRAADSSPEMRVLQESLYTDCEPDKDKQRSSLLQLGVALRRLVLINQPVRRGLLVAGGLEMLGLYAIRSSAADWPAICPQPSFHLGCIKRHKEVN